MLCAGLVMMLGLAATAAVWLLDRWSWWVLAIAWIVLGVAYAGLVTPGGRLLRRSAGNEDLPLLFAAQFSLVHAGWMVAYPLAGWLGEAAGFGTALIALCALRSEEHTSELQSLMRISYAVLCVTPPGHTQTDTPLPSPTLFRCGWWLLALGGVGLGVACACLGTPGGRRRRRSAGNEDLPLLFAAQFALGHAGWMVAYPLAGWLGEAAGCGTALIALCAL